MTKESQILLGLLQLVHMIGAGGPKVPSPETLKWVDLAKH